MFFQIQISRLTFFSEIQNRNPVYFLFYRMFFFQIVISRFNFVCEMFTLFFKEKMWFYFFENIQKIKKVKHVFILSLYCSNLIPSIERILNTQYQCYQQLDILARLEKKRILARILNSQYQSYCSQNRLQKKEISKKEGVSINQFIASAVSEKISALMTEDYLEQRAKRANRKQFNKILDSVPARTPIPGDELQL